jgi:hypothetical protein
MGFFSSSSTTKTNPYAPAKGHIDNALGAVGGQQFQGYYDPMVAGMNPYLQNSLMGMSEFGGAQGMGGQYANQMMGMGMDALGQGMSGYTGQLNALQNRGPNQFRFDQGTYQQMMDNAMPGLRSAVDAQGKISSMGLQSNLGQLTSAAGATGGSLGSNPLSKLGQGGAALQAQTALNNQNFAAGLYNNANSAATQAGMTAGGANMNALNRNDMNVLGGFGKLAGMGQGMAGAGYGAGMNNLGMGLKAGQIQQGYDQSLLDSEFNRYKNNMYGQQSFNLNALQGLGQIGSQFSTQTTTQNPSMMSNLGQVAGLAGSIFGMGGGMGMFGGGGGGIPAMGSAANAASGAATAGAYNPNAWWMGGP